MNRKPTDTAENLIPCILMMFFTFQCIAEPVTPIAVGNTKNMTYPLTKYLPWSQNLVLRNVSSASELSFPIPDRYTIDAAKLHLEFTNSNTLIFHRSQLQILLNESIIAQIKLDPDNPRTVADIVLPTNRLINGYNKLQFRVAQHYTEEFCEVPDSPELWTQINPEASTISMTLTPRLRKPSLAALDYYIDDKLSEYSVQILRTNTNFSENDLKWGALITQGIALRLKFVPLNLTDSTAHILTADASLSAEIAGQQSDKILIGTADKIRPFLDTNTGQSITGSYLSISPIGTKGHVLIVVSGTNEEEVTIAAKTFASLSFPFPDTASTAISKLELANLKPYERKSIIQPDAVYAFKQLGFKTASISGKDNSSMYLKLRLPPDLYAREDAEVEMFLHLAYGAAMRRDSTINVNLNGVFQNAIHLKQPDGAHYYDYRIALPLREFQPGLNTIEFHPVLTPLETGYCIYRQFDNLVVTLFEDSEIHIPSASHYVRLPNFKLLAKTGFPYNRLSNGTEMAVQILDASSQSVRSAWQIVAKLAQMSDMPFYDANLSFEPVTDDRNLILVGSLSGKEEILQGAPADFSHLTSFPYPLFDLPKSNQKTLWERLTGKPESLGFPVDNDHKKTRVDQSGDLGNYSAAVAYQSPWHSNRLIVAFVHNQSAHFYDSIRYLLDPKEWNAIQGNILLWDAASESLSWQQTNDEFYVGSASPGSQLAYFASQHQWLWISAAFLLILLLALLVHFLLNRFKREHHSNAEERHS